MNYAGFWKRFGAILIDTIIIIPISFIFGFVIGFEFIENELELKKLCNFFALITIVPCTIGIIQYLGSYFIDHNLKTILQFG